MSWMFTNLMNMHFLGRSWWKIYIFCCLGELPHPPSVSERSSPDCKSLNQPKMWKVKWGHSLQTTYINIWILKLKQPQIGKYYKTVYCIQYTYRYEPSEMDWMGKSLGASRYRAPYSAKKPIYHMDISGEI